MVQFSKRRAKEKREKDNVLQDKFNNAKQTFESDPTDKNASDFNTAKEKLELCMNKNFKVSSFAHGHYAGCEHGEKSAKYFLNLEKRKHVKKHLRKFWVD